MAASKTIFSNWLLLLLAAVIAVALSFAILEHTSLLNGVLFDHLGYRDLNPAILARPLSSDSPL
jgi:hypothetical protein